MLFIAHSPFAQCWTAIDAAMRMFGEKRTNGRVTAEGLVKQGYAVRVSEPQMQSMHFAATQKGRAMALLLKLVETPGAVEGFNALQPRKGKPQ